MLTFSYLVAIMPCLSEPCLNGGTCFNLNGGNAYLCVCLDGWNGDVCQNSKLKSPTMHLDIITLSVTKCIMGNLVLKSHSSPLHDQCWNKLKGHWTTSTSSPNFFQESWDFYTIRSVYLCSDCMLNLTYNFNLITKIRWFFLQWPFLKVYF